MERNASNNTQTQQTAERTAGGSSRTSKKRKKLTPIGKLAAKLGKLRAAYRRQSVERRRAIVAAGIIVVALLLFAVALIVGVTACVKHRKTPVQPAEAAVVLPDSPAEPEPTTGSDPALELSAPLPEPILAEPIAEQNESDEPEPTDAPAANEVVIAPEPTAEPLSLKKHDERPEVMELQQRLIKLGYLEIDEPTEYYGSATEYAVKLFQRQHGLEQDGVAGAKTLELIYSKDAQKYTLKEGAQGRDVKMLQEQLVDLGYMSSKEVDSVYGAVTTNAVMAFQKRNKLSADGLAGEKTLDKLYSDEAKVSESLAAKQKAEAEAEAAKAKAEAEAAEKKEKEAAAKEKAQSAKQKEEEKKAQQQKSKEAKIDKFISAATSKLGCEYVLGGRGPNTFDCSGFVYWCLRQAGVSTTRLSASGYSKKSGWTEITSYSKLQKGDILFFRSDESSRVSHTGIYIGGGTMIDASSSNGKVVKRAVSNYWKRNLVNARRPW